MSKNKVSNQDDRESLALRIKNARNDAHISQRKLGVSIGVSDKSISSYEKGRSIPPIKKLKKIAKATNKPLGYFTEEETINIDIISKLNVIEKELQEIRELIKNISKKKIDS
jgi:transcriptional regulator with XRE-family HTH domain